jgi:IS5 family transposase
MRFLGLGLGNRGPDAKTVRLYRNALAQAGKVEVLFGLFDSHLSRQGYIARGGQILDACIVPVLRNHKTRNHSTRDKNAAIKRDELPGDWADRPTKRCQKDLDARWTKKHGKSHYGYKNHMNVDRTHMLVRRCQVSDAAVHDSQAVGQLLMQDNTGSGTWADAACRSEEMKAKLRDRKLKSHKHRKGKWDKPLTGQAKVSNRTKSTSSATLRVRVEHIFGAQTNDMGGTSGRTIGRVRAKAKFGMKNLARSEHQWQIVSAIGSLARAQPVSLPFPNPGRNPLAGSIKARFDQIRMHLFGRSPLATRLASRCETCAVASQASLTAFPQTDPAGPAGPAIETAA